MASSLSLDDTDPAALPTAADGADQIVRVGHYAVMTGKRNLYFLKMPTPIDWCRERLLWIGQFDEESSFSKCSSDVIGLIVSFLNPPRRLSK